MGAKEEERSSGSNTEVRGEEETAVLSCAIEGSTKNRNIFLTDPSFSWIHKLEPTLQMPQLLAPVPIASWFEFN